MTPQCVETNISAAARARLLSRPGEPLFIADWDRALFLHYEVEPGLLRTEVPFELDLWEGRAYVSLVAFTLRHLRLRGVGRAGGWLLGPIASHEFLNVRTYVRHRHEPGIFFLSEWVPNRLSHRLGPGTFGLPYQLGQLAYDHSHEQRAVSGCVVDVGTGDELRYSGRLAEGAALRSCGAGTLDEFLVERYTAFTQRRHARMFFRIWHEPWLQCSADVIIPSDSLLRNRWPWFERARYDSAHYSPGVREVWMGWPHEAVPQLKGSSRFAAFLELP